MADARIKSTQNESGGRFRGLFHLRPIGRVSGGRTPAHPPATASRCRGTSAAYGADTGVAPRPRPFDGDSAPPGGGLRRIRYAGRGDRSNTRVERRNAAVAVDPTVSTPRAVASIVSAGSAHSVTGPGPGIPASAEPSTAPPDRGRPAVVGALGPDVAEGGDEVLSGAGHTEADGADRAVAYLCGFGVGQAEDLGGDERVARPGARSAGRAGRGARRAGIRRALRWCRPGLTSPGRRRHVGGERCAGCGRRAIDSSQVRTEERPANSGSARQARRYVSWVMSSTL